MSRGKRAAPRRRAGRGAVAGTVGVLGELLLTAGALVVLFVLYQLYGTGIATGQAQNELREQFDAIAPAPEADADAETPAEPALPPSEIPVGDAYAIMTIPRFGDDWEWFVVQGTEEEDLKNGPGHYLDSANPGELGNFSVAAHRSGHGEPFAAFPQLRSGDLVEVRTSEGTFTYALDDAPEGDDDGNRIGVSDTYVVWPDPDADSRDAEATEERITLTTCWPRFGSSHRMYATGTLVSVEAA